MSRFRPSAHDNRWIWWLPWLLPYLFFSVAADGLHNHSLLPSGIPASSDSGSRYSPSLAMVPASIEGDDEGCLACQWNSMTSAVAALCPVLRTPADADIATALRCETRARARLLSRVSRGPPYL